MREQRGNLKRGRGRERGAETERNMEKREEASQEQVEKKKKRREGEEGKRDSVDK